VHNTHTKKKKKRGRRDTPHKRGEREKTIENGDIIWRGERGAAWAPC
jgi:hypothetical protein